jgi:hypothetical protein
LSKNPSSRSFDFARRFEEFFDCRAPYVDQALISLHARYGDLEWMRGRPRIDRLYGYDRAVVENELVVQGQPLLEKMVFWLGDNAVEGWSHVGLQVGITFTHHFYFRDPGDRALARLAT